MPAVQMSVPGSGILLLKMENPIVTYARYPTEQDHIYHYAYWKDGKWIDHEIVNSGGLDAGSFARVM